ncbi:MAG: hypothetical protein AB1489_15950 [Acidobacteriota bacterium]
MSRLKLGLAIILFYLAIAVPTTLAVDPPQLKSISPKRVAAGDGELRIRVKGKKFVKTSIVQVNGVDVRTRFQQGDLLGFIPQNLLAQPGTLTIAVRTDNMVSSTTNLAVVAQGNLTITSIRPRIVVANALDQAFGVIVQGENFDNKSIVRVGGKKTVTDVQRTGEFSILLGTVDPAEVKLSGSVPVQIENRKGEISNTFNIVIAAPAPDLNELDPGTLDVGSGQKTIKVIGNNFDPTSKVFVNGQQVTSRFKDGNKDDDKQTLETDIPASFLTQIGQLTIQVKTDGVGDSDTVLLDVTPPKDPLIFTLNPAAVSAGIKNDFDLLIAGANFTNVKNVFVNGAKTKFTDLSKRFIRATIKAKNVASAGMVNIQVETKDKMSNTISLVVEQPVTTTTIAGDVPGFLDGTGKNAFFANPHHAAMAPDGLIYIADQSNHAIRRLNPTTGEVVTVSGDPKGRPGFVDTAEINKNNPTVRFNNPIGIAIDSNGILYISDFGNNVIRRLRFDNSGAAIVDTVAGRTRIIKDENGDKEKIGVIGFIDDAANLSRFNGPYGVAMDVNGNLLIADSFNNVIRKLTFENGQPTTVATIFGNGFPGLADGSGSSVQFNTPTGIVRIGDKLLVTEGPQFLNSTTNNTIRQVDLNTGQVSVVVGLRRRLQSSFVTDADRQSPTFSDGTRFLAVLNGPISATMDDVGNIYFIDFSLSRIRRAKPDGTVTTIAGNSEGTTDGAGTKALFRDPRHIIFIGNQTLLVVDSGNHRIRKITVP